MKLYIFLILFIFTNSISIALEDDSLDALPPKELFSSKNWTSSNLPEGISFIYANLPDVYYFQDEYLTEDSAMDLLPYLKSSDITEINNLILKGKILGENGREVGNAFEGIIFSDEIFNNALSEYGYKHFIGKSHPGFIENIQKPELSASYVFQGEVLISSGHAVYTRSVQECVVLSAWNQGKILMAHIDPPADLSCLTDILRSFFGNNQIEVSLFSSVFSYNLKRVFEFADSKNFKIEHISAFAISEQVLIDENGYIDYLIYPKREESAANLAAYLNTGFSIYAFSNNPRTLYIRRSDKEDMPYKEGVDYKNRLSAYESREEILWDSPSEPLIYSDLTKPLSK